MRNHNHRLIGTFAACGVVAASAITAALADAGHGGNATGRPGKAADAARTVTVEMTDNRYTPERITIAKGETVRFAVKNQGELVHEFNIGTPNTHSADQKKMMMMVEHGALEADKINHDRMMMKMPNGKTMEQKDPNAVLLEPGKSGDVVWTFPNAGEFEFACNVPGHYDAGMVGKIVIK